MLRRSRSLRIPWAGRHSHKWYPHMTQRYYGNEFIRRSMYHLFAEKDCLQVLCTRRRHRQTRMEASFICVVLWTTSVEKCQFLPSRTAHTAKDSWHTKSCNGGQNYLGDLLQRCCAASYLAPAEDNRTWCSKGRVCQGQVRDVTVTSVESCVWKTPWYVKANQHHQDARWWRQCPNWCSRSRRNSWARWSRGRWAGRPLLEKNDRASMLDKFGQWWRVWSHELCETVTSTYDWRPTQPCSSCIRANGHVPSKRVMVTPAVYPRLFWTSIQITARKSHCRGYSRRLPRLFWISHDFDIPSTARESYCVNTISNYRGRRLKKKKKSSPTCPSTPWPSMKQITLLLPGTHGQFSN